jgi:hypothetical protein
VEHGVYEAGRRERDEQRVRPPRRRGGQRRLRWHWRPTSQLDLITQQMLVRRYYSLVQLCTMHCCVDLNIAKSQILISTCILFYCVCLPRT